MKWCRPHTLSLSMVDLPHVLCFTCYNSEHLLNNNNDDYSSEGKYKIGTR